MKILLCIYTCEGDRPFLEALESTALFQSLGRDPRLRVLEVYADAALPAPELRGDKLVVDCPEAYASLSVKTLRMVQYCLRIDFDFLLKLDSTIARYGEKQHNRTEEMLAQLSPAAVGTALARPDFFEREYNGLVRQRATEEGFVAWMSTKELRCDYRRVFPGGESTPEYYLGKFYSLSRSFCQYIASHGHGVAAEHQRYLGGSEDLMIGRLYERYRTRPAPRGEAE